MVCSKIFNVDCARYKIRNHEYKNFESKIRKYRREKRQKGEPLCVVSLSTLRLSRSRRSPAPRDLRLAETRW